MRHTFVSPQVSCIPENLLSHGSSHSSHMLKFFRNKENTQQCSNAVRHRRRKHNTFNPHKYGKDNQQWQQKDNLSGKGQKNAFSCLSNRRKGVCRNRLDSVNKGKKHINPEKFFCKQKIFLTSRTENSNNLPWRQLKKQKATIEIPKAAVTAFL